ncbi:DNA double-strand break repair nuclease NurA [Halocatena halophila]|uniref:DNA double-strand break repair nuclease NurA n=1 Tax=Halocatena halophila TaxID=2814576 RepID=UPI002ED03A12
MTLDPVHFKGITQLADRIQRDASLMDYRDLAEAIWTEQLDPLEWQGRTLLEPIGELSRRKVSIEGIALADDPFETRHGLDSGTINPTTFKNGLVLDVAQAVMSAIPSDLDLHRRRTVVMTVHSNDATIDFHGGWRRRDDGFMRKRVLHTPRVSRGESAVVHDLALYLAESEHVLEQADRVEELLVLDGPIYPRGLLNWQRSEELRRLLDDNERPHDVIENYIRIVERFAERDVPLVGFVKTPLSRMITRTVEKRRGNAPWVNDAAFFSQLLEPDDDEALTFTNWFRSRGGQDELLSADGDACGVERRRDPAEYEVTYCVIYDPRDGIVYRLEAPAVFTRDKTRREQLTRQILKGVAVEQGPPLAVEKADSLAKISKDETRALQSALEQTLEAERDSSYDAKRTERWGL